MRFKFRTSSRDLRIVVDLQVNEGVADINQVHEVHGHHTDIRKVMVAGKLGSISHLGIGNFRIRFVIEIHVVFRDCFRSRMRFCTE